MDIRKMYRIAIDGKTDIGRRRDENEDAIFWNSDGVSPLSFIIVADGMGGYQGGATASNLAMKTIERRLTALQGTFASCTPHQRPLIIKSELLQGVLDANQAILDEKLVNPDLQQMGTTLVVAVIWEKSLLVAHVGDSRAYLWDSRLGLKQLTRDHSVVQEMIDSGALTEADARFSKVRNQLTRAVGVNIHIQPTINQFELSGDCLLLLCTDGMTEYFANDEIEHVLATHRPALECCYRFIDESNQRGGKDNITVAISECKITDAPSEVPEEDDDNTIPFKQDLS